MRREPQSPRYLSQSRGQFMNVSYIDEPKPRTACCMPASGRSPAFAACCSAMKKYLSVSGGSPSPNDDVATTITSKFFASSANSSAVLGAAEPSSTFSCFTSTPPAFQPLIVLFIAMRVYPLSVPTTTTTRGAMMQRTVVGEARGAWR